MKIQKGQYVKFSKLISHDRFDIEDENRMELINKDGRPVWVPVSERDLSAVSSYLKWEQAFRVFSDIYVEANPSRAHELIQYNHVIHTALQSFYWDNVYKYDRLFRMHMEANPSRSWAIILQQAWSICLKDKIGAQGRVSQEHPKLDAKEKHKPCYKFNKGKCTYGFNCKFDHKCLFSLFQVRSWCSQLSQAAWK